MTLPTADRRLANQPLAGFDYSVLDINRIVTADIEGNGCSSGQNERTVCMDSTARVWVYCTPTCRCVYEFISADKFVPFHMYTEHPIRHVHR